MYQQYIVVISTPFYISFYVFSHTSQFSFFLNVMAFHFSAGWCRIKNKGI